MKMRQWFRIGFAGSVWVGCACAEPVDPCTPEEARAMQTAEQRVLSGWLPNRIQQLEAERVELLGKIALLPQHAPTRLPERLGYHSIPLSGPEGVAGEANQVVEVQFDFDPWLGAIAFVPTLVPGEEGSYAFPKRFKIEVIDRKPGWKNKQWVVSPPPYEWVEVVNWMDEDFPNPGPYPVFFSIGDQRAHQLRLTVAGDAAESGIDYHALGEMYLFNKKSRQSQLESNMMVWKRGASINMSDGLFKPPLWDKNYLYDGVSGMGLPLSEATFEKDDFMVSWGVGNGVEEPVRIILDLGEERQVGRIQLWPSEAPYGMSIPLFGFPGKITMELSAHSDFSESSVYTNLREWLHQDNLLSVHAGSKRKVRYIRLTLEDLAQYKEETILGLGEIMVTALEGREVLITGVEEGRSIACAVSASGLPQAGLDQLHRLVDGFSRKRRILREVEWIRGLAVRRPLDRRLAEVELELNVARDAWAAFKLRGSIWGGALLGVGLLSAMGLQRLQRRKVLKNLKTRITRDLHDEVGSSLGGISLTSEDLEEMVVDEGVKSVLLDLSLMAREACASLREVVWVTDQDSIRLPALIEKMMERAEKILRGVHVVFDVSQDLPNVEVSLGCKRHLVMFFREVIHNCARHANAEEVQVSVEIVEKRLLKIAVRDNGCGFDLGSKSRGWGLGSMRKRAEELRGELEMRSTPDEGTFIALSLPLNILSREPTKAYNTSN